MLFVKYNYLYLFFQKTMAGVVLILVFCVPANAQNESLKKDTTALHLNPLLVSSFRKTVKPNPGLNDHFKIPNNQLMYWPMYPLTAAQIEARDKKYNEPVGKQIAEEVIGSYLNSIINGKNKKPVASVPKF
jgi:hypothetical protein